MNKYATYFDQKFRKDSSDAFTVLTDDAPEELRNLVREIHEEFDCLPNNWIYNQIANAFDDWDDYDDKDDFSHSAPTVDVYYSDLYKWAGETYAHELINEALQEGDFDDLYKAISHAQYCASETIYSRVQQFLEAR